ncbi:Scr1 family TA system antitoxin-like transcriptional regulator [Kitasatospora sp. NPDC058162]|uniref:helix-turn-helix domain-containing protein n=1 Tax=Kitasatospora sp. NPDC058162 TaxID=3346362 RepID=UPI0036D91F44
MGALRKSESGEDIRTELPEDLTEVSDFFRAIGKQIKLLRERAGLTQRQLAERVGYTEQLIRSVERGVRTPQPELLIAVDRELNAGGLLAVAGDDVISARAKARVRHPAWFRDYVSLEDIAIEHHEFTTLLIPGLLQTAAYARAIHEMRQPALSEEVVEMRVAARLTRQEILARWPKAIFSWVIDESVLMRPLGGRDVLREQLERLLEVGKMRGMSVQIMPLDRTEHAGMAGAFILITPKGQSQHGYIEAQTSSRLITDPDEVRIMNTRYGTLRAQACSPQDSLALIEKRLGEL